MTMTKFRVDPMEPLDFIKVDPSASDVRAQWVYFYLDPYDSSVWFSWRCRCENAVSTRVWYGTLLRWSVPVTANAKDLTQAINDGALDDFLNRIVDGFTKEWDGSNFRGHLTPDADEAVRRVQKWFDSWDGSLGDLSDSVGLWDAADWFASNPPDITSDISDEELAELAKRLEAEARNEYVVLVRTREYLEWLREKAAE